MRCVQRPTNIKGQNNSISERSRMHSSLARCHRVTGGRPRFAVPRPSNKPNPLHTCGALRIPTRSPRANSNIVSVCEGSVCTTTATSLCLSPRRHSPVTMGSTWSLTVALMMCVGTARSSVVENVVHAPPSPPPTPDGPISLGFELRFVDLATHPTAGGRMQETSFSRTFVHV
jgi:hypothetical protein